MRGYVVEMDGDIVALCGVLHTTPLQVFSWIDDSLLDFPVTIMKTAKRLLEIMKSYDKEMYAYADTKYENSPSFLEHLGFEFVRNDDTGRLYKWQKQ